MRFFLPIIVLVGLLVRGFVPAGFTVSAPGRGFEVVICTSAGVKTIALDVDGQPEGAKKPSPQKPSHDGAPCLYCATAHGVLADPVCTVDPTFKLADRLEPWPEPAPGPFFLRFADKVARGPPPAMLGVLAAI